MKKPVIAVDFDDVVGDFNQAFIDFHNRTFDTTLNYDNISDYNISKAYGVSLDEIIERIEYFCHHLHQSILPTTGAKRGLYLLKESYELHIVTGRCESLREITANWLDLKLPGIFTDLHFTNGFGTKYPNLKRNKSEVCVEIGATTLIDDALIQAEDVASIGIPVILPDRPWNQGVLPLNVVRVKTWEEIVNQVHASVTA